MANFYDLKKALHFPRAAGVLNVKADTLLLHALLCHERARTRSNMVIVLQHISTVCAPDVAQRLVADMRQLDTCYADDIALLGAYIQEEGLS